MAYLIEIWRDEEDQSANPNAPRFEIGILPCHANQAVELMLELNVYGHVKYRPETTAIMTLNPKQALISAKDLMQRGIDGN